jgi:hypothetical protein
VTFIAYQMPSVTTSAVTNIATNTATGNGNLTVLGVPNPTQHGFVWSTSANPTTADSKTTDGPLSATGAFTGLMNGLNPGTLYHVRAYATNTSGTVYGADVTFITYQAPTVTTQAVTAITATTAIGNGTITRLGVPNPTEYGIVWSTSADPTTANNRAASNDLNTTTGVFTASMTALTPGTLYHVRAYATNATGTVYGADVTFTPREFSATTQAATGITNNSATGHGIMIALGVPAPTEYGVVWSTSVDPTIITGNIVTSSDIDAAGAFTASITGLAADTPYYVRAYATNADGTVYGDQVTFSTLP